MSDLIKHLRSNTDSIEDVRRALRRPKEFYNTLYFPNLNDVRLCPKNACSTIKTLYAYMYKLYPNELILSQQKNFGTRGRQIAYQRQELTHALIKRENKYQFRDDSNRIAIVRDPVDRALSAVKYLYRYELGIDNPSYKQVVDSLNEFVLRDNSHFFTQSHYMGYYDQYDKVYTMTEVNDLIKTLLIDGGQVSKIKNDDHFDPDKYPFYSMNKSVSEYTVDDLPNATVERIKHLYDTDYQNGWY